MPRFTLKPVFDFARRVATEPASELGRWEAFARYLYDFGRYGYRQLRDDNAPLMAGALAFRSLFGLLPVLVMGAVVVRALRGPDDFINLVTRVINGLGLYQIGEGDSSLGDLINQLVTQAASYNATALGWIGLLVLMYSAISLMVTIENSFNTVCRAPSGRSWVWRVLIYWFVLTVGPVLIGLTFWANSRVASGIEAMEAGAWALSVLMTIWTFIINWLLLTCVYALVPNTHIKVRNAMIGAFVSALLLTVGKNMLGAYLSNAVSVTRFEGSLGLIPLFMFWVYVMWLFILFGVEVSALLQSLSGRRLREIQQRNPSSGLVDPTAMVRVLQVAVERYESGKPTRTGHLASACSLPENLVERMLKHLVAKGFLLPIQQETGGYVPARPGYTIEMCDVLQAAYALIDDGQSEDKTGAPNMLRAAQLQAARGRMMGTASGANPMPVHE
jgi:membrane protein